MASTNFVVHVIAGAALFVCFYYLAVYRANQITLISMLFNRPVKKLLDPCALMLRVFDLAETDYDAEITKSQMCLVDLGLFGKTLAKVNLKGAQILVVGQKPVVVLTCQFDQDIEASELKADFKKSLGLDFEINAI